MFPAPCPEVGKLEICLVGGRAISSLVTAPAPAFPSAAFGVPRPRSGHSGAEKSAPLILDL